MRLPIKKLYVGIDLSKKAFEGAMKTRRMTRLKKRQSKYLEEDV